MNSADTLVASTRRLALSASALRFPAPVVYVYNPMVYARAVHEAYLHRFAPGCKKVLFLGMNPGPFGMAQTGVPFGEVTAVRNWLKLDGEVGRPAREHPLRPVEGFACRRSEVSGRRLWGLFQDRFRTPAIFFREHFVHNYCPLAFLSESGANLTPDRIPGAAMERLSALCDGHLRVLVETMKPLFLVGIGRYAAARFTALKIGLPVVCALHPSPASPAANRDWAGAFAKQMQMAGVWKA